MRLGEQRMRRRVVPAGQRPVERLGTCAEVHVFDHRVGEKERGDHSRGQLVRVVRLSHHEHDDERVLRVHDKRCGPAVHFPE